MRTVKSTLQIGDSDPIKKTARNVHICRMFLTVFNNFSFHTETSHSDVVTGFF